ncbi:MAG: hypothetical protein EBR82_17240 [Caulobacteraceae bacterium]|nr:hypothetical protein [Caulobacteraceae bacterium]
MAGKTAFGAIVKIGSANPPTTTLSRVTDVAPPNRARDAVDVTDHSSSGGAMEYIPDGVYDPGDLVVTLNHISGSSTDAAIDALFLAGGLIYVQWTENAASGSDTMTSAGVIASYQVDNLQVKGKQSSKLTIKLSGPLL